MVEVRFKGFGLASALEWVDINLPGEDKTRVYDALSEEFRQESKNLDSARWYPVAWFDEITRAVASVSGDTEEERFTAVAVLTTFIAKQNLSSVMKLLIKFLTPVTMMKQLPKIWMKYFDAENPPTSTVTADTEGYLEYMGSFGVRYLAPAVGAWVKEAFTMLGVSEIDVREVNNAPDEDNPKDFKWEIRWTA
jgi:hypothetical protein